MSFVPTRIRVPQVYLLGEDSPGLKLFRRLVPPFVHLEVIQPGSSEYDELSVHSVTFEAGENLVTNVAGYMSGLLDERMGQSTKEFYSSTIADSIVPDTSGKRLGIPLLRAMIAEIAGNEDSDYIDGATKVYVIHPPRLENELLSHLSTLPVPAMSDSPTEKLISVCTGEKTRHFVVEPYKMDLTSRHTASPRWLIVHLYNPAIPALVLRVGAQGPLTLKEPTPLLSDTAVAENWSIRIMEDYLRKAGIEVQDVCHEPNGPKTFPDYRIRLDGVQWHFEITRVLGDLLEGRQVLDKPRDAGKNMDMAIQSPPIQEADIEMALARAIRSKGRHKEQSDEEVPYFCLVLLNVLDLNIDSQSTTWNTMDLTSFDSVVVINGYSTPRVELITGTFRQSQVLQEK